MEKRDRLFSLFLLIFSAGIVAESFRMPRMQEFGYGSYAAPGIVPGLIGAALFLCALLLLIRSTRKPKSAEITATAAEKSSPAHPRDLAVTLSLVISYTILIGRVPFWLATFLFVAGFILYFEWKPDATPKRKALSATTALAQAIVVAVAVTWLFEQVFRVQLPG